MKENIEIKSTFTCTHSGEVFEKDENGYFSAYAIYGNRPDIYPEKTTWWGWIELAYFHTSESALEWSRNKFKDK